MGHDAGDRDAAEELTKAFKSLDATIREAMSAQGRSTNTNVTKIDASGYGVFIALVLVAFLAGLNIAQNGKQAADAVQQAKMAGDINEVRRKQDRDDDYVMSIFRMVPEIKQKIDADKSKEKVPSAP